MNGAKILQRIIKEEGNCCWSNEKICATCPLSKSKTRPDGSNMNCIEAVGVEGLSEEQSDLKYKEAALRHLLDIQVESALEE